MKKNDSIYIYVLLTTNSTLQMGMGRSRKVVILVLYGKL